MNAPRVAARLLLAVLLPSMLLSLASLPAQAPPPVEPPQRFERILWVSDLAQTVRAASALGFTGVQLGAGADPAPVVAAGLSFYLDQPIGKGALELRDTDVTPLRQAYEKTRDPAVLVRPGCLARSEFVDRLAAAAAAEARRVAGPGLLFVALADEASMTRHDAPLDLCWCGDCLAEFRRFAERRYRTIDALNAAFGTQYATFADVVPVSTDQVRRRELGDTRLPADLRAFAARLDFVDAQFATAVTRIQRAVAAAVAGVPVGLTGTSAPAAFGGGDPARLLPQLTLAEPYAVGGAEALTASLLPAGAHRYATLFPPAPETPAASVPLGRLLRAQLCDMAAHGLAGAVVWNDATVLQSPFENGEPTPFGRALQGAMRSLGPVLDACAGASPEPSPIWLVESQPSVRVWWMLDSAGDGMTWVRRLASYEATHSTSQNVRASWIHVLRDLGFQPRFVAADRLAELLPVERPRCVVLPATIALSDRAAQALESYARIGGTVVADHSTGLYDEQLRRRPAGVLDELFGIRARSLRWEHLRVREGRLQGSPAAAAGDVLPRAEHELRAELGERHHDGDAFAEQGPDRGHAIYLNAPVCEYASARLDPGRVAFARELRRRVRTALLRAGCREPCDVRGEGLPTCIERVPLVLRDGRRVLAIRLAALDAPRILGGLADGGPCKIAVTLPAPRTLRHLGGGEIGDGAQFELELDPFGALFLEQVGR